MFASFSMMTAVVLCFSCAAFANTANADLPRFVQVNANLARGGRPSDAGLVRLKETGVRTIVNLENDVNAVQHEMSALRETQITEVSSPMRSWYAPPDEQIDEILALLRNPGNYPIYLHCKHGEDRTGLVMGLYRFYVDGWSAEDAYREMRALGFHPILWNLNQYFRTRVEQGRPAPKETAPGVGAAS